MKKIISVLMAALLLFSCAQFAFAANAELTFRSDGTFTILHLTDTQDDHYPSRDMLNLLRRAVDTADPDLIVFTGDLVEDSRIADPGVDGQPTREGVVENNLSGGMDLAKTRANVEAAVAAVFGVLEEAGVPYVIALGNNDRKVGLTTADWLEIFGRYPHCVAFDESGDAAGGLDYHVSIRGRNGAPKFNVWLMDTLAGGITKEQVDWYKSASGRSTAANGGKPVPAFAFQHIQAADIGNLFEPCSATAAGARRTDNGWVRLKEEDTFCANVMYGYAPGETTYEFSAWKSCGDVLAAYFGHQHVEGFSGRWQGIEMGFTYGCEMAKPGPYGFRVFTLHENDITNYENVLYEYTGKAALGTDQVQAETDTRAPQANRLRALLTRLRGLFQTLVSFFANLFT